MAVAPIQGVNVAFQSAMLAIEPLWTRLDTLTPTLVASYQIRRGRQDEFERTGTGTATIQLNDRTGALDPLNAAGAWGAMLDGRQAAIAIRNPTTDTWETIFRGFTDTYQFELDPSGKVTRVALELVDALDYLAGVEVAPGTGAGAGAPPAGVELADGDIYYQPDEVDLRIRAALADAAWPDELTTIFSGNVLVRDTIYSAGTAVLQIMQDAADAEWPGISNVYVSADGKVTFHGRHARFDPEGVSSGSGVAWNWRQWQAGDGSAGAGYAQLRGLAFARQRSLIINAALAYPFRLPGEEITDAEMAAQVVSDGPSITDYGVRSWSAENLLTYSHKTEPTNDLQETRRMADYYVGNYAQPMNRVTQLMFRSVHPSHPRASATWGLICGVEISDEISVKTQHAGGGGFADEKFFVEGISYDVQPLNQDYPDVTLTLDVSPRARYAYDPFTGDT